MGTAFYIAPEVLQGSYTQEADLWSLGCMVYMMATGEIPIPGRNDAEVMRHVLAAKDKNHKCVRIYEFLACRLFSVLGADCVINSQVCAYGSSVSDVDGGTSGQRWPSILSDPDLLYLCGLSFVNVASTLTITTRTLHHHITINPALITRMHHDV